MSGSVVAAIVIPVVVFVVLVVWIWMVMRAARNPAGKDSGQRPRSSVSGGVFRGDPRQQMPHRDAPPPEVSAGEGRTADENRPGE